MAKKNIVIAGKYQGIRIEERMGRAYLSRENVDFSKENVQSIGKIDQRSGSALAGAVVAGVEGAIIAGNSKTYLVEIQWKDGGASLIKVTPKMFEVIVATSYMESMLPEKNQEEEKMSDGEITCSLFFAAVTWLLVYFLLFNPFRFF